MHYNFRDTIDASGTIILPSEALSLNGIFIENVIPGYRTLHVRGREALSPELDTFETGVRDGSVRRSKRFPARIITVTYQLSATSNTAFRDAYNLLGEFLNCEDAEMIFNDEPDKYFIGTPSLIGEVEPGKNIVVGEIEFLCTDPFKYSVEEYEISPTALDEGQTFIVDYKGTYKSFPTFQANFYSESETDNETEKELTGDGDCGYVAFFNEDEKIIQLGNPGETDGEDLKSAQTLTAQDFNTSTSWGSTAKKRWVANSGIANDTSIIVQKGTLGLGKPAPDISPNLRYLTATAYGSGSKYHGAAVTRTLPADDAGEVGATNWNLSYSQKLACGTGASGKKQYGMFQTVVTDANGKVIAGVSIYKVSTGTKGNLRFWVNGKIKKTITIDLSAYNKHFGSNTYEKGKLKKKTVKASSITKEGSKVTFNIGGLKYSFTVPAIADLVATKVTFGFYAYGTKPALNHNGLYKAKFVKNNCTTWIEVPNKFSSGDVCECDCKSGEILLNDSSAPHLGALGNDYEQFYLKSGINQIGIAYSDWIADDYAPTFTMRYREVFL